MKCSSCAYIGEEEILTERKKSDFKKVEVMEKGSSEVLPKVKEICAKCGNEEAYTWIFQTREGDEPETIFFKCTKCEYTWRSESRW